MSSELDNECSVYYPTYRTTIYEGGKAINIQPLAFEETVEYMPYGDEQVQAMVDILIWMGKGRFVKQFIKPFSLVKIPVLRDGDLAKEFRDGTKLLQPLLFSHGLTTHRMNYSGICRELASYGFLVIALNHNDRSCLFTKGSQVNVAVDGEIIKKR